MRLGCHVNRDRASPSAAEPRPSIVAHVAKALEAARELGGVRLEVVQIFVGGPHSQAITLHADEAAALREFVGREGVRVVAHSSYACYPWKGNPHAAAYIREELRLCQASGISGLVVHLPKLPPQQVLAYLPRLVEPAAPDVRVYLETPANVPAETYYETPEKLAALFEAIAGALDPGLDRFGLCVDTAHLWVAGVDLRANADAAGWLEALCARLPGLAPERGPAASSSGGPAGAAPRLIFHLNDSQRPRGVGPDAHASLLQGRIWAAFADAPADSGLAAVADFARRRGSWLILERKPPAALVSDFHVLRRLLPELAT